MIHSEPLPKILFICTVSSRSPGCSGCSESEQITNATREDNHVHVTLLHSKMFDVGDVPLLEFGNCALKTGVIKWPLKMYVRF